MILYYVETSHVTYNNVIQRKTMFLTNFISV